MGSSPSFPATPSVFSAEGSTTSTTFPLLPSTAVGSVPVSLSSVTALATPMGVPGSGLPPTSVATAVACVVAVLVTEPVVISAASKTYVMVPTTTGPSPTAKSPSNPAFGTNAPGVPGNAARPVSLTVIAARDVLPVFSTVNSYVTVSPASPNTVLVLVSATAVTDFTNSIEDVSAAALAVKRKPPSPPPKSAPPA